MRNLTLFLLVFLVGCHLNTPKHLSTGANIGNVDKFELGLAALGIGKNHTLVLKRIDATTGEAQTLQSYPIEGIVNAFELTRNNTRVLVQVNSNTIKHYSFDRTVNPPTLTLLDSASVPGNPTSTWGMCGAPDGSSAHLVSYGSNTLYSFKINGDTISYTESNTSAPAYLVNCRVSKNSKYLIASGYYSGIKSFQINPTTAHLTELSSYSSNGTSWIDLSDDGKFIFATNQDESSIKAFELLADGSFLLKDTKLVSNSWPDFIKTKNNGAVLYVNCQGGYVLNLPFNTSTKTFGTETVVSTHYDWFTLSESEALFFEGNFSTGDTTIYVLNPDGSLGTSGSIIEDEGSFRMI